MTKRNKPTATAPATSTHGALALVAPPVVDDAPPVETSDAPVVVETSTALTTVEPSIVAPSSLVSDDLAPTVDRQLHQFVDEIGKDRVNADRDLAMACGLSVGVEVQERGYTVNSIGVANAKRRYAAFDALPSVEDGIYGFLDQIKKEERKDETIETNKLRTSDDGFVFLEDDLSRRWKVEPRALRDLANDLKSTIPADAKHSPANFAAYLESCPADRRAADWNYWQDLAIKQRGEAKAIAAKTADTTDLVVRASAMSTLSKLDRTPTTKLRTRRDASGNRSIFGGVGEQWVPIDVDHVGMMILKCVSEIEGDIRARIAYNGWNAKFDLITHSNVKPENYVVGEIFSISARVGTDDTGGGSIYWYSAIRQGLCENMIILHEAKGNHGRVIHRGDPLEIMNRVIAGIQQSLVAVASFAPQWTNACNDRLIIDGKVLSSVSLPTGTEPLQLTDRQRFEIFASNAAGLVTKRSGSNYLLPMPGTSDKQRVQKIVPELLRHFASDLKDGSSAVRTDVATNGGLTRAALVNSLTRFAHESERDPFRGADLEKAAGSILAGARGTQWALPSATDWEEYAVDPVDLVTASAVV